MCLLLNLSCNLPKTYQKYRFLLVVIIIIIIDICLQLEQQRQQLLTERQTFHTEQLKQAEMKVRQQREQQGFTGQHSGQSLTRCTLFSFSPMAFLLNICLVSQARPWSAARCLEEETLT